METIVGERINATRTSIRRAIESRDADLVAMEARRQQEAGATHIDVNAGTGSGREREDMMWLASVVQDAVEVPLCLDSPHAGVMEAALSVVSRPPIVNSISLEEGRLHPMLELLQGRDCGVVALCMSDEGLPGSPGDVVDRAGRLVEAIEDIGVARERIYVDILIQPIAANTASGKSALEAVRGVRVAIPGVHVICGLSNVSFGMPQRAAINQCFLAMLMASGLDAVILDPLKAGTLSALLTARMLLGLDPYGLKYIEAANTGRIV